MKRAAAAIQLPATRTAMRVLGVRSEATRAEAIATTAKIAQATPSPFPKVPARARASSIPFHEPFQRPTAIIAST
jgi:hypothetical protein